MLKPGNAFEFIFSENSFIVSGINHFYQGEMRFSPSHEITDLSEHALIGRWRGLDQVNSLWLHFDKLGRRFYGTPQGSDLGYYQVRVNMTQYGKATFQVFSFHIYNNHPYTVESLKDVAINLDGALSLQLPDIFRDDDP